MSLFGWQMWFHFISPDELEYAHDLLKPPSSAALWDTREIPKPNRVKQHQGEWSAWAHSVFLWTPRWLNEYDSFWWVRNAGFPPRVLSVRTSAVEQFVCGGKYSCYVEWTKGDRPSGEEEEFSQDQFSAHWSSVRVGENAVWFFWFDTRWDIQDHTGDV